LSSLDAVADGDPIWGSITGYNGPVLSSGGGDTAMRGHQGVAVDHRAIEMVVRWPRLKVYRGGVHLGVVLA
jgi:hypothetical protein